MGRYLVEDLKDPKTGEMICSRNKLINVHDAERIVAALEAEGKDSISIRSVLQCQAKHGVCAKCYGANLANGNIVQVGEAVGVISAQSIGEPGTQLTMRTFHTGGIASAEDITQGLPRVEELFESRRPKGAAIITRIDGVVRIEEVKKTKQITVTSEDTENPEQESYAIPYGYKIRVREGQAVTAGEPLTEGSINPADILAVNGPKAVQNYIITEVQKVYRLQGVDINDKHIEVIVRQMMRKVKIDDSGSSYLLPGSLIDRGEVARLNEEIQAQIDAVLRKMLLSVSSFLPAPVWTFTTTFRWSRMRVRLTITPQKHRCTNDFYISLHGSFMRADFFILYETFLSATAF